MSTKKTLLLTSCSSKKLSTSAPAKFLYQGVIFKKIKKIAKNNHFDFKIISAKYGLLNSNEIIKPYDKSIKNKEDILQLREIVIPKLKSIQNDYDLIIIIMGEKYRQVIKPALIESKYKMIHDTRGIGGLTSRLNKYLRNPIDKMLKDLVSCKIS